MYVSALIVALISLVSTESIVHAAPPKPEAALSALKKVVSADEAVRIKLKLKHKDTSIEDAEILRWLTVDVPDGIGDAIEENIFSVVLKGEGPVQYLGAHVKRPEPTPGDYIKIPPGQQRARMLDLAKFYDFSVSGTYEITYSADSLTSNTLSIDVVGRPNHVPVPDSTVSAGKFRATKNGEQKGGGNGSTETCTAQQKAVLQIAQGHAEFCTSQSRMHMEQQVVDSGATSLYDEWFGAFGQSRADSVYLNYISIEDAWFNKASQIKYDCKCKQKYYAYVYPNQPYNIYLCAVFWQTGMTGTDSKQGTLVHEMSHFDVVAQTDDIAYGQSNCRLLADNDPSRAIQNADSHEYFCESFGGAPV